MTARSIWIGYDPREAEAFAACRESIRTRLNLPIPIYGLVLDQLRADERYWRETERRGGQLWDVISDAPMATEFAVSRFLVPYLAGSSWKTHGGYALFMDCDMLVRANFNRLFDLCEKDQSKAVWCVKHKYEPDNSIKMDGQLQLRYARKNWSSFMVFNLNHPSNKALTLELVNTVPGRDLHRFCWLKDEEIGELSPEWNFLVGHTDPSIEPKVIHFTEGGPWMAGYENVPFADEWRKERNRWAA